MRLVSVANLKENNIYLRKNDSTSVVFMYKYTEMDNGMKIVRGIVLKAIPHIKEDEFSYGQYQLPIKDRCEFGLDPCGKFYLLKDYEVSAYLI